jgi:hypothetical protein
MAAIQDNDSEGDKKQNLRRRYYKVDEEDSLALYDVIVKFSLRVFQSFLKESKTSLNSVISIVLMFCISNFDGFEHRTTDLIRDICGEETSDAPMLLHSFSSALLSTHATGLSTAAIQGMSDDITELAKLCNAPVPAIAKAVQYIFQLSNKAIRALCDEALRWAAGCGEVQIAACAAKLVEMFIRGADPDTVKILIRTIHIFTQIITERSDPGFRNASSFLSVIIEKPTADFPLAIQYITLLVKVMAKATSFLKVFDDEAYWLCTSLINVADNVQMPIACACFRFILDRLKDEKYLSHIANEHDSNFHGFLRPILRMEHTTESLTLAYEVIVLLICGHPEMLTRNASDGQLLLMTIMPYLFAYQHSPDVDLVIRSIIDITPDAVIKEHLARQYGSADDFAYPIMARLVKAFNESAALQRIVGFYTHVAKAQVAMLAPVLSICTAILQTPALPITLDCFGQIGFTAIHDNDVSRNTLALNFLSSLNNRGGFVQPHSASRVMKKFPNVVLHKPIDNQVKYWQPPEREDPFDRIINLPPLTLIDIEYLGVAYQQGISRLVANVKVQPLDDWTRAMNRAEALRIEYIDEGENAHVKVPPDAPALLKLLDDVVKGEVAATTPTEEEEVIGLASVGPSRVRRRASKKVVQEEEEEEEDEASEFRTSGGKKTDDDDEEAGGIQFLNVASVEFLPEKKEIETLGADILQGFTIAPLFPTNLR